jgi:hypothetical protein
MKKFLIAIIGLISSFLVLIALLLVASLFALHSPQFTTNTLLPIISERYKIPLEASEIKLEKFSRLHIENLKYGEIFTARVAKLSINLPALLDNNIEITNFFLKQPSLKLGSAPADEKQAPPASSQPPKSGDFLQGYQVTLNKGAIEGGNFEMAGAESKERFDINDLHLTVRSRVSGFRQSLEGNLEIKKMSAPSLVKAVSLKSKFNLLRENNKISVKQFDLNGGGLDSEFLDLSILGELFEDLSSKESSLTVTSKKLLLTDILSLFGIEADLPEGSAADGDLKAPPPKPKPTDRDIEPIVELPPAIAKLWMRVDLNLKNVHYNQIAAEQLQGKFTAKNSNFMLADILIASGETKITGATTLDLAQDRPKYSAQLQSPLLKIAELLDKLQANEQTKYTGSIHDLSVRIEGEGFSETALEENLNADISVSLKEVDFDRELENVVPFNLIFAPFNALQRINEFNPLGTIPSSALGPLNIITDSLGDMQSLHCNAAEIKVQKRSSNFQIETATFEMGGLVPDLQIPGTIEMDGSISLNSSLGLHGQWFPMPLRGTLDFPYPDIPVFIKELGLAALKAPLKIVTGIAELPGKIFSSEEESKEALKELPEAEAPESEVPEIDPEEVEVPKAVTPEDSKPPTDSKRSSEVAEPITEQSN